MYSNRIEKRLLHRIRLIRTKCFSFLFEIIVDSFALFLALRYRFSFDEIVSFSNPNLQDALYFDKNQFIEILSDTKFKVPLTAKLSAKQSQFENIEKVDKFMVEADLSYPIVWKPNSGGQGTGVKKVKDRGSLKTLIKDMRCDHLVQEFCDYPIEIGVFYTSNPGKNCGDIIEISEKSIPQVEGDGRSTMEFLIEKAKFHNENILLSLNKDLLNQVPAKGCKINLGFARNRATGGLMTSIHDFDEEKLTNFFDEFSEALGEFCYGRLDIFVKSYKSLETLDYEDFMFLEANGVGSAVLSAYYEDRTFSQSIKSQCNVIRKLFEIVEANRKKFPDLKPKDGWKFLKFFIGTNYQNKQEGK